MGHPSMWAESLVLLSSRSPWRIDDNTWIIPKNSDVWHSLWPFLICHCFHLLWIYRNFLVWDDMTKKLYLIEPEITIRDFCIQLMLPESLQCQPQVLFVLLKMHVKPEALPFRTLAHRGLRLHRQQGPMSAPTKQLCSFSLRDRVSRTTAYSFVPL